MQHSTRNPTKDEAARMAQLKELPCVACLSPRGYMVCGPVEVHHLLSGNKRRGHDCTIPLGTWHHRGIPIPGWTAKQATETWGPSLALSSKKFRATYGTDDELLEKTNILLSTREGTWPHA